MQVEKYFSADVLFVKYIKVFFMTEYIVFLNNGNTFTHSSKSSAISQASRIWRFNKTANLVVIVIQVDINQPNKNIWRNGDYLDQYENPIRKYNRFRKGSGSFICQRCGKRTRNTGYFGGNLDDNYCKQCLQQMEEENERTDRKHSLG